MDKFDAMQMFVRVIEKGSFSAVAKERGIGQPAVSKQISALEDELGTELIHRNSRSVAPTEAGRDFYDSASHILEDFENATSRIGRGQTAPKGLIRITVPPTFARLHMVSKLPAFFAAYPDMSVEMAASESPTTIIEDGFDLAIHSGDLPDSTLVARKFAQTTPFSSPLRNTSRAMVRLNRRTISIAFDRSFLWNEAQCNRGALAPGQMRNA